MKIYFLQSQDGQFFKSRGQSGYGPRWVEDMEQAKPYLKIGQAKAQITRWNTLFPSFGVPLLVECDVTVKEVIDLTKQVKDAKQKKLEKLVQEANQAYQEYLTAPEPQNWKDQPRINYKRDLAQKFRGLLYKIRESFKESDFDMNKIGLNALHI